MNELGARYGSKTGGGKDEWYTPVEAVKIILPYIRGGEGYIVRSTPKTANL